MSLAQNIDALIPFAGGLYCTYLAFRGVPAGTTKTAEWEQWYAKWGLLMKIGGPLMIAVGLLKGVLNLAL